ncbi:speckle-type POZ protein-like [Leptopilina heterotoma]|uniref:speckle-type POZ protein-like n=1 Tax=Leptopilina heterotoma TaxID=63436 RepID=UPI001CA7F2A0|nr:speckle-type POZ protein-like [Leptopilina heterotoma]
MDPPMECTQLSYEIRNNQTYSSKLKLVNNSFYWKIENFKFICKYMKVIRSPTFVSQHSKDEYSIEIQPTELKEDNEDLLSIRFICAADITKFINFNISIGADEINSYKYFYTFKKVQKDQNFWIVSGSALYKAFKQNLPSRVVITCEFSVIVGDTNTIKKPLTDFLKCNELIANIKSLLHDEDLKDVVFKIEDEEFTAHKIILASRSPVFAAMFKNKMNEELTSIVEIDDIRSSIFQQMLNFIYTDQVEDLEESAFELIDVAEKYQLENLKSMCINSLNDNLSVDSVIKTLEIAELYSVELLRNECLKFMYERKFDICETNDFQELIKLRPNLWIDILKMEKQEHAIEGIIDSFNNWGYTLK